MLIINDAQMSGLSMIDPKSFYKNLYCAVYDKERDLIEQLCVNRGLEYAK